MTALPHPSFVSVEDYLAGEEQTAVKHEYLGGVVYAMAGGTNDHAAISANAIVALGSRLRGKTCRGFSGDAKVRIELSDHTRFYYPDAQVACSTNAGTERFQERPSVIVEVLSESTRRTDLGEKRDAYLAVPSLKALIFVESNRAAAIVYRRRAEGGFTVEEYAGEGSVDLPEIEAALPLSELYEGVALPEK
jgi:Uma2 family endonuclease